jgi:hypothetical protein
MITDKPDLQDPAGGVGVEVTRAMLGDAGRETGLLTITDSESRGKEEPVQTDIAVCQYRLSGGSTVSYTGKAARISDMELLFSFHKKLQKLNNEDFRKYKENDLYIFSPMFNIFGPGSMEQFAKKAEDFQLSSAIRFDNVFVNDFARLFICGLHSGKVSAIRVSEEKQRMYCLAAKERADRITRKIDIKL